MSVFYLPHGLGTVSGVARWNANLIISENQDYYVQYGYKITVPTLVGVGLDSSSGNYTYSYDQYNQGSYVDIKGLSDLQVNENISVGTLEMESVWQSVYDDLKGLIPEFYAKLPYWVQNPTSDKYLDAQDYYKNNMMNQLPMYGNRLEYFARLFTIDEENRVIVGDWLHWSSLSGSKTQEKPETYVKEMELPGIVNSDNNVDFEQTENTYTSVGVPVGNQPTIINNNYAPNYPDYPTVVTYNHDNILLNSMELAGELTSYFGDFGSFLSSAFVFIPRWIWVLIGTGFAFSIVVMIIKVL